MTTKKAALPGWITVGAPVTIRQDLNRGCDYRAATVERITATQIILREVAAKFRTRDLMEIGPAQWPRTLVDPSDQAVRLGMARNAEVRLMGIAEFALQQYPRRGYGAKVPDAEDRTALRAKLADVLAEMDRVDDLATKEG